MISHVSGTEATLRPVQLICAKTIAEAKALLTSASLDEYLATSAHAGPGPSMLVLISPTVSGLFPGPAASASLAQRRSSSTNLLISLAYSPLY